MSTVLLLGSAPDVVEARDWPRAPFDHILAINNAWAVRDDWDSLIHAWDFPPERRPLPGPGQQLIAEDEFVPAQNQYGGFVYAGGTMAFTAAYWALAALRPAQIAVLGCDMEYPVGRPTHFYGTGAADPLRPDVTLQSLEAKSARLMILAARQGCAMVNLSQGPSRQVFPRVRPAEIRTQRPRPHDSELVRRAFATETALGYQVPSGRYWEELHRFDPKALRQLDAIWLAASRPGLRRTA